MTEWTMKEFKWNKNQWCSSTMETKPMAFVSYENKEGEQFTIKIDQPTAQTIMKLVVTCLNVSVQDLLTNIENTFKDQSND